MLAEDLNDLYKLLRGNKAAGKVLEARTLAIDGKHELVVAKLGDALESYKASRSRFLKPGAADQIKGKGADADRQRRTAERKYEKTIEVIEAFEEMIPQVEKMVERDRKRAEREAALKPSPEVRESVELADDDDEHEHEHEHEIPDEADSPPASKSNIDQSFVEAYQNAKGDDRLDVVHRQFDFREVASPDDVRAQVLYFINSDEKVYLVETTDVDTRAQTVALADVIRDRPLKKFKLSHFVKLGTRRQMVMLTQRTSTSTDQAPKDQAEYDTVSNAASATDDTQDGTPELLDIGAFSQLLTAAQRSGLVPGADQIAHTRDREFRKREYDLAFQAINNVFSQFTANANSRASRLTREDADIASGRVQMSPKDVVAKRARDRAQTAEVERARRRFQVVLEGLRQLIANQDE